MKQLKFIKPVTIMGSFVLKSRTDISKNRLASTLFGKTRRAVLALLYGHVDECFYFRQIIRETGTSIGALQRELKNLSNVGIIRKTVQGPQVYYQANPNCPIFAELKNIVIKTIAIGDVLKDALTQLEDRIKVAFLFGSMVNSSENSSSDVDIMVIGNITFAEVTNALNPVQEKVRREINPVVYPPAEFRQKATKNHHFLKNVIKNEKLFLIGDEHELKNLAE